jgi:hypothetical protein
MSVSMFSSGRQSVGRCRWPLGVSVMLLALAISFKPAVAQQTGTITGVVTTQAGEPVVGAQVMLVGTQRGTLTDARGAFLIPNVIEVAGRRVTGTTIRLWQPVDATHIRVYSWLLVERNAPQEWKNLVRRTHVLTFGASGTLEQDDTEVWEAITRNAVGLSERTEPHYLDYTMGMGAEPLADFPGPGTVFQGKFNEASARGFYRRWLADITREQPV